MIELRNLFRLLALDLADAFAGAELLSIPLAIVAARLKVWQSSPEDLSRWVAYFVRRRQLESLGLSELVAEIHGGDTNAEEAVSRCEMAFYEEVIRDVFGREPDLATFNGASHEQLLGKFRRLDTARIDIARHEVALAHYERLP